MMIARACCNTSEGDFLDAGFDDENGDNEQHHEDIDSTNEVHLQVPSTINTNSDDNETKDDESKHDLNRNDEENNNDRILSDSKFTKHNTSSSPKSKKKVKKRKKVKKNKRGTGVHKKEDSSTNKSDNPSQSTSTGIELT